MWFVIALDPDVGELWKVFAQVDSYDEARRLAVQRARDRGMPRVVVCRHVTEVRERVIVAVDTVCIHELPSAGTSEL